MGPRKGQVTMTKALATRVSDELLEDIDNAIKAGKYVTYSEYLRSAIREKLERDKK